MNANPTITVLLILFARIFIPLAVTALIVYWLHKLDVRWQAEAEKERDLLLKKENPCWIEQGFSVKESRLRVALSEQPCWQVHRLPNGHLLEACQECAVYRLAAKAKIRAKNLHAHL